MGALFKKHTFLLMSFTVFNLTIKSLNQYNNRTLIKALNRLLFYLLWGKNLSPLSTHASSMSLSILEYEECTDNPNLFILLFTVLLTGVSRRANKECLS